MLHRVVLVAVLAVHLASVTAGQAAGEPPAPTSPPAYTPVRWNEDYRFLATAPKADFFDPIKYIPLGSDPEWYLSLGGQARYRYEYFNNLNFSPAGLAQDEDGYHLTRLFFHADAHFGKNFRLFVQAKSAMEDGRDGGPRPIDADEVDIQQAFFDVMVPLGGKSSATLRLGRQDLIYGAQRLISPLDWTNTRRTFEGGKLATTFGDLSLDLFWVHPVNVEKEELNWADSDTSFAGIYGTLALPGVLKGGGTKLEMYGLALNRTHARFAANAAAAAPARDEDRYTVGVRFSSNPKPWDFDVEADYQFGQFGAANISAWSVAAEGGYTLARCPTTPRLYLGFDYASGDDDPTDNDLNTFNQLFPLGHAYFGYIDVIGRQNIIDLHPGIELTLLGNQRFVRKMTLRADYHLFWRASDDDAVYNVTAGAAASPPGAGILRADSGSNETFIGSELDFLLTWQVDRHLQVYFGYSRFFAGDFIQQTGAGKDIDFAYMAAVFNF